MLYEYLVFDLKKRKTKGLLDAGSAIEVRNALKEKKYFIIYSGILSG
jgi:type II secretory pathway component PulF